MNYQPNANDNPLILAVKNQNEDSVRILLKANFDISQVDQHGESVLQKIPYKLIKDSSIPGALLMKLIDKCKTEEEAALKLLDAKCPLYIAVLLKNNNITKFFLDRGMQDIGNRNEPALHVAVIHEYFDGVKLLIECGFDVNSIDLFCATPLYCVREVKYNKEEHLAILKLLLDRGAELTTVTQFHKYMQIHSVFQFCTKEAVQLVLQAGIDFFAKDRFGATPLHYLACNKNTGVFEVLKDQILDIEAKNRFGSTALHYAAFFGHHNNYEYLLKLGANVNFKNNKGETLLFWVLKRFPESSENVECIEVLLRHGAEIQVQNSTNKTVFDTAIFCRNFKLIQPVLAHLALLEDTGTVIIDEIRDKIESLSELKNPFELYKQQLEQLKNTMIFESVNMFELLTVNERKLFVYLRNQQLVSNARLVICQNNENTYYYRKFQERIELGLQKMELRRRAAEVLCEIMHFYYDSYPAIIDKIFNYLDESEILKIEKLGRIKVIR